MLRLSAAEHVVQICRISDGEICKSQRWECLAIVYTIFILAFMSTIMSYSPTLLGSHENPQRAVDICCIHLATAITYIPVTLTEEVRMRFMIGVRYEMVCHWIHPENS
jgi:hypothetical protein